MHGSWLAVYRAHLLLICTDSSGNSAGTCAYEPFGEFTGGASACTIPTSYRFAGMQFDSETGFYHTWFRQYDPSQGRWLSVDPLSGHSTDPQSLNRYVYVLNDPVNLIDPLGLACRFSRETENGDGGGREEWFDDYITSPDECERLGGTWVWADVTVVVSDDDVVIIIINTPFDDSGRDRGLQLGGGTGLSVLDARAIALGQALNATGIQVLNPEICGGGYFVLRGEERDFGPAHFGALVIVNRDSQTGTSVGYLVEGGVGPVAYGREQSVHAASGEVESSHLLFIGKKLGAFLGFSGRNSPIQVGAYVSALNRGGGAYVNLVPGGQCH